jgi:YD repeat-containing protein
MKRARLLAVAALVVPAVALAHAVVFPRASAPGAYEKYVLRVPNEKDTSVTTRVEIQFPTAVRVISFADVPGWQLQVRRDSTGRITGATWTGSLPPERFVEFPFVAVNPREETRLVWPVYQTYSDGERVGWVGPENGDEPASVTTIRASDRAGGPGWTRSVAVAALALALFSLAAWLRARRAGLTSPG